jgi:hypothetical protein
MLPVTKRTTLDFDPLQPAFPYRELFEYNAEGELIARVDGADASGNGNRYINFYDSRGLLQQETQPDPDGGGPLFPLTIKYAYDNMGRPTQTDRGYGRVTKLECYGPNCGCTFVDFEIVPLFDSDSAARVRRDHKKSATTSVE